MVKQVDPAEVMASLVELIQEGYITPIAAMNMFRSETGCSLSDCMNIGILEHFRSYVKKGQPNEICTF